MKHYQLYVILMWISYLLMLIFRIASLNILWWLSFILWCIFAILSIIYLIIE